MKQDYSNNEKFRATFKQKVLLLGFLIGVMFTNTSLKAQICTINALNDQIICETEALILGNSGSVNEGTANTPLWTQIAGPTVVIVNAANETTPVLGIVGGNTYAFRLSATCIVDGLTAYDDVIITVNSNTLADAGADIQGCPGDYTLAANAVATGEIGTWTRVSGPVLGFSNVNSPTSTITLSETSVGITTLRWTITNGLASPNDCSSSDIITVTNYGGNPVISAGGDQTLSECYTTSSNYRLNASEGGNGAGGQIGTWSFVSGPSIPTFQNDNNRRSWLYGLIEGTYVLRWTVTGSCISGSDEVELIVPAATQSITSAGGINQDQRFCTGVTSTVLEGNVPLYAGETIEWEQTGGPLISEATALNTPFSTTPTTTITGLNGSSDYTFRYTITGPDLGDPLVDCSSSSTFRVRYYTDPVTIQLNGGNNNVILAAEATSGSVPIAVSGGSNYSYQLLSGPTPSPAPIFNVSAGNFNFSRLTEIGTYTVRVTRYTAGQIGTGCGTASDDINIIVSTTPIDQMAANAGTDAVLACNDTDTNLSGNDPSITPAGDNNIYTGFWSQVNGPNSAIFANTSIFNTNISGLVPGVYTFRWHISGGIAGTVTTDEMTVTVSSSSNSLVASPVFPCSGDYQLLATPLGAGETGLWTFISGPSGVTFTDDEDPMSYVASLQSSSTYVLRWSVTNSLSSSCDYFSEVTINTTSEAAPSPAVAGPDQCNLSAGTTNTILAATIPAIGSGVWSLVSGPNVPTITTPTDAASTVTGMTNGLYFFQWTTSSACVTSFTDTVSVFIDDNKTYNANLIADQCTTSTTAIVTMAADDPSLDGLTGTWFQSEGDNTWTASDINDPNATFSGLIPGFYEFEWRVDKGGCATSSSTVSFNVNLQSSSAILNGASDSVCRVSYTSSTDLGQNAAQPITNGIGTWSLFSGPNSPTIVGVNNPDLSLTGLVTGTYVFRWTSTSNNPFCAPSLPNFADFTLTVETLSNPGADQNLCNVTEVFLQGTEGSIGTWSETIGPGPGPINGSTLTVLSGNTAIATIVPGQTYYFEFDNGASCDPVTLPYMIVTNSALSEIPIAGNDQDICLSGGTNVVMDGNDVFALSGGASTGTWTKVSGPSVSIPSPNAFNATIDLTGGEGLYIFEWTSNNGGNCGGLSDIVRVNAYSIPGPANITSIPGNACQFNTTLEADAPTFGLGVWELISSASLDPTGTPYGNAAYNPPAGYTNGDFSIDSPNNPNTGISIADPYTLALGNYTFRWKVSNGTCIAVEDFITINYSGFPPTFPEAGPDQFLCDATNVVMNGNPIPTGTGTWSQIGTTPSVASFSNTTSPNTNVSGLIVGTYQFMWTSNNGGCSFDDVVEVTIYDSGIPAYAGLDQDLVEFANVVMAANDPATLTGEWSLVSGPTTPIIIDVNSPTTQIAGTVPGVYEFKWTVENSPCATTSDNVVVTISKEADLSLVKVVDDSTPDIGDNVTFTVTVTNDGPSTATDIDILDYLPAGLTYVSHTASNGAINYSEITGGWVIATLASGSSEILTITATVNATEDYTNFAEIVSVDQQDPDSIPGNNDISEDDRAAANVIPNGTSIIVADLRLTKTVDNSIPNVGSEIKFTITVFNDGPSDASGIDVVDLLPSGYTLSGTTAPVVSQGSYTPVTGLWDIDILANGANATLVVTAIVNASGNYTNFAEIVSVDQQDSDSIPGNNDPSEDDQDFATIDANDPPVANNDAVTGITTGTDAVIPNILSNDLLSDGSSVDTTPVTGNATVDLDPSIIGVQNTLTVAGEGVWTYNPVTGDLTFNPDLGFTANPTPLVYTLTETSTGLSDTATVSADYITVPPVPQNDSSLSNTPTTAVTVAVIGNDADGDAAAGGIVDPTQVSLVPTGTATSVVTNGEGNVTSFVEPGEGTWEVNPTTGAITFTPETGFTEDPTPAYYNIEDNDGNESLINAIVTIDYVPVAVNDESLGNTVGNNVTLNIVSNDTEGDVVDLTTFVFDFTSSPVGTTVDGTGLIATVPNEGTWTYNPSTGELTFNPESGFTTDPSTIDYTIEDSEGNISNLATVTISYSEVPPLADDDSVSGVTTGTDAVIPNILSNDLLSDGSSVDTTPVTGNATVDLDPSIIGVQNTLTVAGEGVWTYNPVTGDLTFNPDLGFTANPTPLVYTLTETSTGLSDTATVSADYITVPPVPQNDSSLSNTPTTAVTVAVIGNDADGDAAAGGIVDPTQVSLVPTGTATSVVTNGEGNVTSFVEPGEGTWEVNPTTGAITFTPETGFTEDPTPAYYNIEDNDGNESLINAIVTIDYVPVAVNDESLGNTVGNNVTLNIVSNDTEGDVVDLTTFVFDFTSSPVGTTVDGTGLIATVPNEGTWTYNPSTGELTFNPESGFTTDPSTIDYTIEDSEGNISNLATVTISYSEVPPLADDDSVSGVTTGTDAVIPNILSNDLLSDGSSVDTTPVTGNATVDLDPSIIGVQNTLTVAGEGVWTYNPVTGDLTFNPDLGFTANPTALVYTLTETSTGLSDTATVSADYIAVPPIVQNDISNNGGIGHVPGTAVTLNPIINNGSGIDVDGDAVAGGVIDPTTVSLITPAGALNEVIDSNGDVTSFDVAGEGNWSVDGNTGFITFTPLATFNDDPTPILYNLEDNDGNVSNNATVTIDYAPIATDDINSVVGVIGLPVSIDVTLNDLDGDIINPATVVLDATSVAGGVQDSPSQVTVPGVGVWLDNGSGIVTFTPNPAYTLDPPVIEYTIQDAEGNVSNFATITFDYEPIASDDISDNGGLGHPVNTEVTVNVLANDNTGDTYDSTTVSLVDPGTAINIVTDLNGDITSFEIPGEGTWNVDLVTGQITFDPEVGFILSPTPISYNVEDHEGNQSNDALVTIIYVAQADIEVVKTDNYDAYTPGLPIIYTITVTNNGPANASGVIVNDDIIAALEAVTTWTGNGSTVIPGDITNNVITTLNSGSSVIYTVTINVPSGYVGDIVNTASAALPASTDSTQPVDPDLTNNTSTDTDTENAKADLSLTKVVDNTTPNVGSEVTFTITVTNDGPSDASGIDVVDLLPSGYTLSGTTAPAVSQGTYAPITGLWTVGSLIDGASATLDVTAVVNASGDYTNFAEINYADQTDPDSPHGNNNSDEDDQDEAITSPFGIADLVTTKVVDNNNPNIGDEISYTLTVVNNGPSIATGVVVEDIIPGGLAYVSHVAVGGDLNSYDGTNWSVGTIDIGDSATLTLTVSVNDDQGGNTIRNEITNISLNEVDPTNSGDDLIEDITVTSADLVVVKTVSDTTPYEGGIIVYTVSVTNNGPNEATGVKLVDLLPSGVTYVSDIATQGDYNKGDGNWVIGTISNGSTITLAITATVDVGTSGDIITNTADNLTADQSDPNLLNNIGIASITVNNVLDIVLNKTVDNATPNTGDIITYTVTVTNNGPALATNLVVTDVLPAGLSFSTASPSDGTWSSGVWTIGELASGDSESITIDALVSAEGTIPLTTLTNTVTHSQDQVDYTEALTPDTATATIEVTASDLVTTKIVNNTTPNEGETIIYTIEVENNGPSDATGISLTDLLPTGVTYVSDDASGAYNNGSGIWTIGSIVNGATATLNITATVDAGTGGQTITNTAIAATGDQTDPTAVGNDLSEDIIVTNATDIVLTKVVDNETPNIGDTINYTITIRNNGPSIATNVLVTDALPLGLTYGIVTPSDGTWSSPSWNIGELNPGEEETIIVKAIVGMDQGGQTLINTVTNTQDQVDSNITVDDLTETIIVTSADLVVEKVVSNEFPNEGDEITYTISVTNNGPDTATSVSLIDNLPVGVTYVSHSTLHGDFNYGSGLWSIGSLSNTAVATLTITATVDDGTLGQTIVNITSGLNSDQADLNDSNNVGSATIIPTAYIDLSLTKTVVDDVVNPEVGETITFEIRVMNDGPTEATGVQVIDLIPSGYDFVNYSSSIGTYNPITGLWNIGFIEVDNTAVLLVDVIVLDSGNYINCAEVTAANEPDVDSTPNNGDDTEDDYDCAAVPPYQEVDLAIEKKVIANNFEPAVGSQVSFQIKLTNLGDIEATEVIVEDILPAGYTFVNYSSSKGEYDFETGKWNVGTIDNSEPLLLIIDVLVNADETGNYENCATIIELHQVDPNPVNDTSCVATMPIQVIDLELTKEVELVDPSQGSYSTTGVLQPYAETNVNFTINISNYGPSTATGVHVTDLLPDGYNFVNANVSVGTYDEVSGIWNIGVVENGAIETMVITAYVNPLGNWINIAEVTAANELDQDSTPGNGDVFEDDMDQAFTDPIIPLTIPEGFSPDGDGINEIFEIEFLQILYPNFSMEIVNRYGNIVYKYKHDGNPNTTPRWWDGYSDGRWNLDSLELPVGTYFYTIYFNNNERKPQTGWVYLRR